VSALVEAGLAELDRGDEPVIRRRQAATDPHRVQKGDEAAHRATERAAHERTRDAVTTKTNEIAAQIRSVFIDSQERAVGDVCRAIGSRNWSNVTKLLMMLAAQGELVKRMDATKTYFRLATADDIKNRPAVKSIAVPAFDIRAFDQKLAQILASGASYDLRELVRNIAVRWPQADSAMVEAALDRLDLDGKVERIPLGSTVRFRKATALAMELA
jgi:hypothetical protein